MTASARARPPCSAGATPCSTGRRPPSRFRSTRWSEKLAGVGRVSRNPFLLRLAVDDYLLTIFPDGRAIIGGTDDPAIARSVYARYIGS